MAAYADGTPKGSKTRQEAIDLNKRVRAGNLSGRNPSRSS